jgi:hypothetical protein
MGTKVFFPANFHHWASPKKKGVCDLFKRTFFSWEKWAEVTIVIQGISVLKSQDLDLKGL